MFFNSPQTLAAVAATTTAAQITALSDPSWVGFWITPTDGTVYLGDSTVSSTNGQPVNAGQTASVAAKDLSSWYVRTASGTVDVRVMAVRGFR